MNKENEEKILSLAASINATQRWKKTPFKKRQHYSRMMHRAKKKKA